MAQEFLSGTADSRTGEELPVTALLEASGSEGNWFISGSTDKSSKRTPEVKGLIPAVHDVSPSWGRERC